MLVGKPLKYAPPPPESDDGVGSDDGFAPVVKTAMATTLVEAPAVLHMQEHSWDSNKTADAEAWCWSVVMHMPQCPLDAALAFPLAR